MPFKKKFHNNIIVYGNISNGLEKGYLDTQILQFSQKFKLFWGVVVVVDQTFRIWGCIDLRGTLFLIFFNIFRWRRWVVIWEDPPRPKVDLLDFHNISRI